MGAVAKVDLQRAVQVARCYEMICMVQYVGAVGQQWTFVADHAAPQTSRLANGMSFKS